MIGLDNDANAPKVELAIQMVKIRYKVVETARYSFRYCKNLVTAYLPRTLKKINEDLFYEAGVTSLVVSRSVEILDFTAFSHMTHHKSLVFEL